MADPATIIGNLFRHPTNPRTDGELLTAFRAAADESAFAELLRRHGPMVLAACRRWLSCPADAEDAFQTVFLVLVRKAACLDPEPPLGPWLHRVAVFTARNARRRNAYRLTRQFPLADEFADYSSRLAVVELRADLDNALLSLPEKFRAPLVLFHLQGLSRRAIAQQLRCPEGTVSSLISRGLAKLRRRLAGIDPVKSLAIPLTSVPVTLSASTARVALAALESPVVFHSLSQLGKGVIRMFMAKKATAALAVIAIAFGFGVSIGFSVKQTPQVLAAADPPIAQLASRSLAQTHDEEPATDAKLRQWLHLWATPAVVCGPPTGRLSILIQMRDGGELKLSEEQMKAINSINDAAGKTLLAAVANVTANPKEPLEPQYEKRKKELEAFLHQFEQTAFDVLLTPQQNKRLTQLYWHSQGVYALFEDEIAKLLDLSVAQKKELANQDRELLARIQKRPITMVVTARDGAEAGKKEYLEKVKIQQEGEAEMWKVLTPQQERKWRDFVGPPSKR